MHMFVIFMKGSAKLIPNYHINDIPWKLSTDVILIPSNSLFGILFLISRSWPVYIVIIVISLVV